MPQNYAKTFKGVQKRKRKFFEPDNYYRGDMDTGFQD